MDSLLLCSDYYEWKDWTSNQYYCTNEVNASSTEDAVLLPIKPEELKGILIHDKEEVDATEWCVPFIWLCIPVIILDSERNDAVSILWVCLLFRRLAH